MSKKRTLDDVYERLAESKSVSIYVASEITDSQLFHFQLHISMLVLG